MSFFRLGEEVLCGVEIVWLDFTGIDRFSFVVSGHDHTIPVDEAAEFFIVEDQEESSIWFGILGMMCQKSREPS
jgi:hypothetical protein